MRNTLVLSGLCRRVVGATTLFLAACLAPGQALAHYPWMTPSSYSPGPGEAIEFSVGWGHDFPGTSVLDASRLASAELVETSGEAHQLPVSTGELFSSGPLPGEGPWILAAQQAPAFFSRTPRGGQRSSRAENPDALSCGHTTNAVKAVLGGMEGAVDHVLGHELEIVPLAWPAAAGSTLPVRVLFKGQPWEGVVQAAYAGFKGADGEYPVEAGTDADGVARVAFDRPGRWMLKVTASEPYPDPAVCDRSNYNATLTVEIR